MLNPKNVLSLHTESTVQNVALALTQTDGVDIFDTPRTFRRPFDLELKELLWDLDDDKLANEEKIQQLNDKVTDFFISLLQEAVELWSDVKIDYISISGHFVHLSAKDKYALELGNLQKIADNFQIPVVGHYVQSDLNAGGTGSPLLSVFWQAMTKDLEKPLAIVGLGGVLKLTYVGQNGELGACDIGVGLSLLEKWMARHSMQTQDEEGILSAGGKSDKRVLKALMNHPFLSQPPPKAVHRNDFDELLEQVEGLSLQDGCATLTDFIVEQIANSADFFEEKIEHWLFIGTGRKNATLMLALQQRFQNVYIAEDVLPFNSHLNAVGYSFLGARTASGLPISLPSTTGTDEAVPCGNIFYPTV